MTRLLDALACWLGWHRPVHTSQGGETYSECGRPGCDWFRRHGA